MYGPVLLQKPWHVQISQWESLDSTDLGPDCHLTGGTQAVSSSAQGPMAATALAGTKVPLGEALPTP